MESKGILKKEPPKEIKEKHKQIQEAINKNEMKQKVKQVETKIQKMHDPYSKEIPMRAANPVMKDSKALVLKKKEVNQDQKQEEDDNESL